MAVLCITNQLAEELMEAVMEHCQRQDVPTVFEAAVEEEELL